MNFSCGNCGRSYVVADEKVRGRSFKVKCRACDQVIVVRPPPEEPVTPPEPPPAEIFRAPPAPPVVQPPPPAPVPQAGAGLDLDEAANETPEMPEPEARRLAAAAASFTEIAPGPPPPRVEKPRPMPSRQRVAPAPVPPQLAQAPAPPAGEDFDISESDPAPSRSEVASGDWFSDSAQAAAAAAQEELPELPTNDEPVSDASLPGPARGRRPLIVGLVAAAAVAAAAVYLYLFGGIFGSARAPAPPVRVATPAAPAPVPVAAPTPPPPAPAPIAQPPDPAPPVDIPAVAPGPRKPRVGTDALMAGPRPEMEDPAAAGKPHLAGADPTSAPEPAGPPGQVRSGRGLAFEPEKQGNGRGDKPRIRRIGSKDKKLLDLMGKKADSAPAAPVEKLALDTAAPALDEAQVSRTMAENRKAFDACVSRALRHNPGLQLRGRRVTATFGIKPDGSVFSPTLDDAEIGSSELGVCLKATCRRLVFPAFDGDPIEVAVPLALSRIE